MRKRPSFVFWYKLQHLLGRPDKKKHDRNISELIYTFLNDDVSTTFVRRCIMMHKHNIMVTG